MTFIPFMASPSENYFKIFNTSPHLLLKLGWVLKWANPTRYGDIKGKQFLTVCRMYVNEDDSMFPFLLVSLRLFRQRIMMMIHSSYHKSPLSSFGVFL